MGHNRVSPGLADKIIVILHYDDVIMSAMKSQITSLTIVYSIVYLSADQRKHQSSASLAFVRWFHRRPLNFPQKGPVTRKNVPIWWRYHDKRHFQKHLVERKIHYFCITLALSKCFTLNRRESTMARCTGPVFYLLPGVRSDCARPITRQVTSVTWPVIGWAQSELTPSKRQKTGPDATCVTRRH